MALVLHLSKRQDRTANRKKIGSLIIVLVCGVLLVVAFSIDNSGSHLQLSSTTTSQLFSTALSYAAIVTTGDSETVTISEASVAAAAGVVAAAPARLRSTLLKIGAEAVWEQLLQEAGNLLPGQDPGIAVEVGMFSLVQCLIAARAGLETHCVEASAVNFAKIDKRLKTWDALTPEIKDRITLHHNVAGSVTGRVVSFFSGGGTGDRVGSVDVWKMEKHPSVPAEQAGRMTETTELALDDIVLKQPQGAFVMKIDTQGYEPHVFSGLHETLRKHKAQYILLEYWPKGMDLMTAKLGDCSSVKVLEELVSAGYQLYQLSVTAHPRAPNEWKTARETLPLDDLRTNCRWYYDMEQSFPSEEYKLGYWADVLAVAPTAKLAYPITQVGKLLSQPS